MDDLRLDGKVTVITGAAGGIGLATARRALALGARVAVLDTVSPPDDLDAFQVRVDITDASAVEAAFSAIQDRLGPTAVLVNNAGIAPPWRPATDLARADWERVLGVNLVGAATCLRAAVAQMRSAGRPGTVVNVASVAGKYRSLSSDATYAASKAALIAYTRQAGFELIKEGIRVNAVCPGGVATPILERNFTPEQRRATEAAIPIGRLATPEEVAAVICFLAAPASGYMVGAAVDVNGGLI